MSRGRLPCAISCSTPTGRSGTPKRGAKERSTAPFSSASTSASGRLCAKGSRSTASLPRAATGKPKRRPGENLLRRLHKFKDDVLRFLVDFDVPFTNNLAEQALRMMKVKMKISGAFRTFDAAQDFAALRSVITTARKQGWNILQTLTRDASSLI